MSNNLSIGQTLQKERESKNLTLQSVSDSLNIRKSYLEALETGDYSVIPGKAYLSGFIKSYAEFLELDPEDLLKMLKATQNLQENYENMPKQLYKDYKRTKNIFLLSFLALVLVVMAFSYFGYINHQIKIRKIEQKTTSSQTLSSFFNLTQNNEDSDEVDLDTTDTSIHDNEKVEVKTIELYDQKSKPPFSRVLFKAKQDVWIQVRALHKKRIYVSKTIPAGKAYWLKPWENVVLDVSNADDLEIILDDVNLGVLGSKSKRIRGLYLDAESLNTYFEHKEYLNNDPVENYYKDPSDSNQS